RLPETLRQQVRAPAGTQANDQRLLPSCCREPRSASFAYLWLAWFRAGQAGGVATVDESFPFLPPDPQRFREKDSMFLAIALASITIPAKALNDLRCVAISSGVTVVMSKAPS